MTRLGLAEPMEKGRRFRQHSLKPCAI